MKHLDLPSGCACCQLSRRNFLTDCATCVGAIGWFGAAPLIRAASADDKLRIRIIFSLHEPKQSGPDWPNKGFDFNPHMARIQNELGKRCRGFEFVTAMANGEEQAKKILEADRNQAIDGYLVYQMNCWNRVIQTIATSGKPVLYADFQYGGSGGFLVYTAGFLRSRTPNVGFVASSRMDDLVAAVKCFRRIKQGGSPADFVAATAQVRAKATPKPSRLAWRDDPVPTLSTDDLMRRMKASKILAFRGQEAGPAPSIMNIPVVHVPFVELNDAWKAADRDESRAVADRWEKGATEVTGVARDTLEQSAAMYLAMKSVLKRHDANAITINCLGGFYGGHIHAYPCLGFHQLLNEGLVGACECDVRSTATMVALTTATQGRPGYISDPVIDTSKRQIIYAHCVASNRAFGPRGHANPYQILTHSEDRQGASLRSLLPLGYLTTTVEMAQERKEILLHRAKAVANVPDDRACRTKLAAEPLGDIEKLFTQWDQWGWHRVTFYGDLKAPVYALAEALGWKVVEEA
jgi:hypothetical protein